jgi:hypothetical protein
MSFNVGNSFKYLYRCTEKDNVLQDLKKSAYYLKREIQRREPLWFAWENENYDAMLDGTPPIRLVLAYEARFGGWMKQALSAIYTASVYRRSTQSLKQALKCVNNMITIHEH